MIYRRSNGGNWDRVRGRATDISIGVNGEIFVVSTNKVRNGLGIWKYTSNKQWKKFEGDMGASRIAVDN
jgi:hypothetical protein